MKSRWNFDDMDQSSQSRKEIQENAASDKESNQHERADFVSSISEARLSHSTIGRLARILMDIARSPGIEESEPNNTKEC